MLLRLHVAAGEDERAAELLCWTRHLRHDDGSYFTGMVYPERAHFPGGERTTYSAAAVVLATDAVAGRGPASRLFRAEGLPSLGLVGASELVEPDPV